MPVIPSNKPYRVGRSRTGLGLFATEPIKKGTKIIRYFGPLLDSRKEEDEAVDNKYLFEINSRWTIDGSPRENIARYINHACRPNAESDVNARKREVVIRAIKNIEPGEEINYDYGTTYFNIFLKPIGCKCLSCERKREKQRGLNGAMKAGTKTSAKGKVAKGKVAKGKVVKEKAAKGKVAQGKAAKSVKDRPTKDRPTKDRPTKAQATKSKVTKGRAAKNPAGKPTAKRPIVKSPAAKNPAVKKLAAKKTVAKAVATPAHARGSGMPTTTKAGRASPIAAVGAKRNGARKARVS